MLAQYRKSKSQISALVADVYCWHNRLGNPQYAVRVLAVHADGTISPYSKELRDFFASVPEEVKSLANYAFGDGADKAPVRLTVHRAHTWAQAKKLAEF